MGSASHPKCTYNIIVILHSTSLHPGTNTHMYTQMYIDIHIDTVYMYICIYIFFRVASGIAASGIANGWQQLSRFQVHAAVQIGVVVMNHFWKGI